MIQGLCLNLTRCSALVELDRSVFRYIVFECQSMLTPENGLGNISLGHLRIDLRACSLLQANRPSHLSSFCQSSHRTIVLSCLTQFHCSFQLSILDHFTFSRSAQRDCISSSRRHSLINDHLDSFKMSSRLDQSLDNIIDSQKKVKRNQQKRNKPKTGPIGGVKKTTKPVKSTFKNATGPAPRGPKNSKIVVSMLPLDVTENQIKVCRHFGTRSGRIQCREV